MPGKQQIPRRFAPRNDKAQRVFRQSCRSWRLEPRTPCRNQRRRAQTIHRLHERVWLGGPSFERPTSSLRSQIVEEKLRDPPEQMEAGRGVADAVAPAGIDQDFSVAAGLD